MSNHDAHFDGTGPEIWKQTNGEINAFVAGAGTVKTTMLPMCKSSLLCIQGQVGQSLVQAATSNPRTNLSLSRSRIQKVPGYTTRYKNIASILNPNSNRTYGQNKNAR